MGAAEFFKSRLVRLHPLVILGSVLGLAAFLLDPFGGHPGLYSTGKIALFFLCSVFLVPLPIMEERAFNLFGFNAPSWSLFWEYVANILYALVLYKLSRKYLCLVALFPAGLLCWLSCRKSAGRMECRYILAWRCAPGLFLFGNGPGTLLFPFAGGLRRRDHSLAVGKENMRIFRESILSVVYDALRRYLDLRPLLHHNQSGCRNPHLCCRNRNYLVSGLCLLGDDCVRYSCPEIPGR